MADPQPIHPNDPALLEILDRAAKLPPEQRDPFLDGACKGNGPWRREVESLLKALDCAGDFLSLATAHHAAALGEGPGTVIGRYTLLEQIGEGGFGVVFMAEQERPIRRMVALKIIKLGMDTKQVVARFDAERQALALMDHPSIARVFDGGSTESGRPYFVMELVRGTPLHEYCDKHQLTMRDRLALFVQVCQAVQHAHQKGIIHRDLKPSNVLVTVADGKLVPKVIDFGIAKAVNQRLTEKTLFTEFRQLVGTPQYMSPEQAESNGSAADVDTRSDVYSLGVLLYELLTGTTPLDGQLLRRNAFAEMQRMIREADPPAPSTRLSTMAAPTLSAVAASRRSEPGKLGRLVRGELDWIVMKAMEKDRSRRYETANGLARDIERYLADEPVDACPPSALYRLRKLARRYRGALRVAAAFVALLLVATVVSTWQAVRATRAEHQIARERDQARAEKKRADDHAATVNAVGAFLINDLLAFADPGNAISPGAPRERSDPDLRVRDLLDRAAERVEGRFQNPVVEMKIRVVLGSSYQALGQWDQAERQFQAGVDRCEQALGPEDPATLHAVVKMGELYREVGKLDQVAPLFDRALAGTRKALGDDNLDTIEAKQALAAHRYDLGRYVEAEALFTEILRDRQRLQGESHPDTAQARENLAAVYHCQGKIDQVEKMVSEALSTQVKQLGAEHSITLRTKTNLLQLYLSERDYSRAAPLSRQVLEVRRRLYGPEHPDTLSAIVLVAETCPDAEWDQAEPLYREALEKQRRVRGPIHRDTLFTTYQLGQRYEQQGGFEQAERLFLEVIAGRREALGDQHPDTAIAQEKLGVMYARTGQPERAEPLLVLVLKARRQCFAEGNPSIRRALDNLAAVYATLDRNGDAERCLRELLSLTCAAADQKPDAVANILGRLGALFKAQDRVAEVVPLYHQSLTWQRNALGSTHLALAATLRGFARLQRDLDHLPDTEQAYVEAVAVYRNNPGHEVDLAAVQVELAGVVRSDGRLDEAEILYREAIAILRAASADELALAKALHQLGHVVRERKDTELAEQLYREAMEIRRRKLGSDDRLVADSLVALANLLRPQSREAEVEALLREALQIRNRAYSAGDYRIMNAQGALGASLSAQSKHDEAEPLLLGAYQGLLAKPPPAAEKEQPEITLTRIIELYDAWGKPDQAAKWRAELATVEATTRPTTATR